MAEYETIAGHAQHDRWVALLRGCGLTPEQADSMIESESFGPLTAELRRAEADHHDVDALLPRLVRSRPLDDAHDIGAVLLSRLHHATSRYRRRGREPVLIAGLIPVATGEMDDESRTALAERQTLIEARASALAEDAVRRSEPWLRRLGNPPDDMHARRHWMIAVRTVAAYRDRYGINGATTTGAAPTRKVQKADQARARAAARQADLVSRDAMPAEGRRKALAASPSIP